MTKFREPAALVAAVQALLAFLISFHALDFIGLDTQADLAVVVVVLNAAGAFYVAWKTKDTLLGPVVELFKALLALGMIFGFALTTEQTGLAVIFITAALGLFNRQATKPLLGGSFKTYQVNAPVV